MAGHCDRQVTRTDKWSAAYCPSSVFIQIQPVTTLRYAPGLTDHKPETGCATDLVDKYLAHEQKGARVVCITPN